jgi:hypothetical protein
MGGAWQDATPEWKAFCAEVARKEIERRRPSNKTLNGYLYESDDTHQEWMRLNTGTD